MVRDVVVRVATRVVMMVAVVMEVVVKVVLVVGRGSEVSCEEDGGEDSDGMGGSGGDICGGAMWVG